ncbi:hypothetical protein [Halorubellus litoreus]|uniref:Uncharacterized protein n=1 Tax=Halorubellus litoreus TaxID=755308 RepID=A0ABD5VGP0_9EURY
MCPQKRRDLLGLAGATATSLAAGCLSTGEGEFNDSATTDDQTTETDAVAGSGDATATVDGEFAATTWLPEPDAFGYDSAYMGFAGDLNALRDADVTDAAMARTADTFLPLRGQVLSPEDVVELATVQDVATACTFDLAPATVRDRIRAVRPDWGTPTATPTAGAGTPSGDDDTDPETETGSGESGVTRIDAPDGYEGYETAIGVYWLGGDHLLYGPDRRLVQTMVDAHSGDVDRYAANADVDAVLEATGEVDLLAVAARSQRAVADAAAFGYGWRFGDDVALAAPFAFPDDDATDPSAVAQLSDMAGFTDYGNFDVETTGRVVTLTANLSVSEFDLLQRDDGGRTATGGSMPQVSFAFEANRGKDGEWDGGEDERVVVTHQGGDSIALANVALHYEGSDVAKSDVFASTKPAGDTWAGGGEWTLRVDAAGADFESGATLQVVWTSDDGSRSAVIAMFQLP